MELGCGFKTNGSLDSLARSYMLHIDVTSGLDIETAALKK